MASKTLKVVIPARYVQPPASLTEAYHRAWTTATHQPGYDKQAWSTRAKELKIDGYR